MRQITGQLIEELQSEIGNQDIASSEGIKVERYSELHYHIAKLACLNKKFTLFYRGQKEDYKASDSISQKSSFYPTIYRGRITQNEKELRWSKLQYASDKLITYLRNAGIASSSLKILERKSLLQWSILQHYEVVATPLIYSTILTRKLDLEAHRFNTTF